MWSEHHIFLNDEKSIGALDSRRITNAFMYHFFKDNEQRLEAPFSKNLLEAVPSTKKSYDYVMERKKVVDYPF